MQRLLSESRSSSEAKLPKITVVTPSFNQGSYIEETIKSVLGQGYPNLEYLILDGGSTDESLGIIERYADHLAFYCSEPDEGQTAALIRGFNMANGEIYCWLNSDDVFAPGCLFQIAGYFMNHHEIQLVFGNSLYVDREGKPIRKYRPAPFFLWTTFYSWVDIPQASTFFRATLYRESGGLNPAYPHVYMDSDLWLRFAERTELIYIPEYWSRVRMYPEIKSLKFMDLYNRLHVENVARMRGPDGPWTRRLKQSLARVLRLFLRFCRDSHFTVAGAGFLRSKHNGRSELPFKTSRPEVSEK